MSYPMVRDLADMLDDLLEDGAGRLDAAAAAMECADQTQFLTAAVDKLKLRMARCKWLSRSPTTR